MSLKASGVVPDGTTEQWRDRKRYLWLMGLVVPSLAFVALGLYALTHWGLFLWTGPIVIFVIVPLADLIIGIDTSNPPDEMIEELENDKYYRYVTFAFLPLQYAGFIVAMYLIGTTDWPVVDKIGMAISIGCVGGIAINTAHELGHKREKEERWLGKIALAQTAYGHFFIEHNRGHHRRVATPDDPASARRGETVYAFWLRSITGSFASAWHLEAERLRNLGRSPWSLDNQMLVFQLVQAAAILVVGVLAGPAALGAWLVASLGGALLLETVNYIEHYGLSRGRAEHGGWERVRPEHSWNTNRPGGRAFLFDLTRHSDHHAHATRPYAILRHHDEAPEMPFGYPAMILIALVPPLFFAILDPAVDAWRSSHPAPAAR